jgi:hypothetical protein
MALFAPGQPFGDGDCGTCKEGGLAEPPYDFHNFTSGPFSPITGSLLGIATFGIVFSAFW